MHSYQTQRYQVSDTRAIAIPEWSPRAAAAKYGSRGYGILAENAVVIVVGSARARLDVENVTRGYSVATTITTTTTITVVLPHANAR